MRPSKDELLELSKVLPEHALGKKAVFQRRALEYIFGRIIDQWENFDSLSISVEEVTKFVFPEDGSIKHPPENPKDATHSLRQEIRFRLDAFYAEGKFNEKPPHVQAQNVHHRVDFKGDGNYMLMFRPYFPQKPESDLVPFFWRPHLPPKGTAMILYPEPFFLIDDQQTYYRNSAMGTGPDASVLNYLNIPGKPLKTGYSYVPAGIVQAVFSLTKALRVHQKGDFPSYEAVKPHSSTPPGDKDFILLATPSSTDLVKTIQGDQVMTVDAQSGFTNKINGSVHNDDEHTQWGVVTRTLYINRVVTMFAAKHGRSIEAMAKFLTQHKQLVELERKMNLLNYFPETFQVLFRMPITTLREGPVVTKVLIEDVLTPPEEEPSLSEAELNSGTVGA